MSLRLGAIVGPEVDLTETLRREDAWTQWEQPRPQNVLMSGSVILRQAKGEEHIETMELRSL